MFRGNITLLRVKENLSRRLLPRKRAREARRRASYMSKEPLKMPTAWYCGKSQLFNFLVMSTTPVFSGLLKLNDFLANFRALN